MATAKWATPSSVGSNIAGTTLNSLANGSASAFVTHDNSSNLDLYCNIRVTLGSITPSAGGTISLVVFSTQSGNAPDNTATLGGGDQYSVPLTTGASIKELNFPMVRLYPESCRICVVNNSGVALAASGNALTVRPFNESVN
jgi:hypothetical protein